MAEPNVFECWWVQNPWFVGAGNPHAVARAAWDAATAAERERLVKVFTSGRLCRLADHMQGACQCEEYAAAITSPPPPARP